MQKLNLDHLATFLAVLRHGGINRAAEVLNLSQPAVSARIMKLEAAIGQTLFDRSAQGLRPTRAADLLQNYAERFEILTGLVERDLLDAGAHRRLIRIGAAETVTQTWLPDFVSRLSRAFPAMTVDLDVDISPNLRARLLGREIDMAFLLGPVSDPKVDNLPLPAFDLAWYVDAARAGAPPRDLLSEPVVTYIRHTRPFRELRKRLIEEVGPGARIFTSSSLSAIFRLVEAGIGVAAMPRMTGEPLARAGRIATFDPGWTPAPLQFTASWLGEPPDPVFEMAAEVALEAATAALPHNQT